MPAHETRTYSFEDPQPTNGVVTWWAWECSCGAGDSGVGELFAEDLARTHEQRVAPCTCGNPAVATTGSFPTVAVKATCACGYSRITYGREVPAGASVRDLAALRLARHSCRILAGHPHQHPKPKGALRAGVSTV